MSTATGNAKALRAHKDDSLAKTRLELEKALRRLANGNPRVVERGKKISPASVAKEAGVDRSTLYRYHEPVLREIRRLTDTAPQAKLKEKRSELAVSKARAKEYREMLEEAQADLEAVARQNYALNQRNKELEALLRQRDELIKDLQRQANQGSRVVPIK